MSFTWVFASFEKAAVKIDVRVGMSDSVIGWRVKGVEDIW